MAELLASAGQLRTYLDLAEADLETERAELLLRIASGEVRAFTGRLFDEVVDEVRLLDGTGASTLMLPDAPVSDVAEVLEAAGTDNETELDGPGTSSPAWEWTSAGYLRRIDGGFFVRRLRWYQVTYDHGYATIPDDVLGVVLAVAGRAVGNPDGTKQEAIGRYSYTAAGDAAGIGLLEVDRTALVGWRIDGAPREGTATGS